MLAALDQREVIWFGWSGDVTDEPAGATRVQREGGLTRMLVDLERSDYEGYYLGFANRVLWPVFHYRVNLAEYSRDQWAAYNRVNEMLAERLASALKPDDVVWVHDYHMIPFGAALRRLGRRLTCLVSSCTSRSRRPRCWRPCRYTRRWCARCLPMISSAFRRERMCRPSVTMSSGKPTGGLPSTGRCTRTGLACVPGASRSASTRG